VREGHDRGPFADRAADPIRRHRAPVLGRHLAHARAGHDAILDVGVQTIRAHNVRLTDRLAAGALERGFDVPTPLAAERRTGWIGMDFPGADRATAALVARRVFVDYRPGCGIRVSPHFYTSDAEIDAFFAALDDICRTL